MVILYYHLVNGGLSYHLSAKPIYWTLKAVLDAMDAKPGAVAASVELHRQSLYAILKQPRAERIDAVTLERLCAALNCQPGDLLRYEP